jgi:hypothetical protein
MKRIAPLASVAALGLTLIFLTAGCLEEPGASPRSYKGPLLRYHFGGPAGLPTGTNAAIFREIFSSPASVALRGQVADKLAATTLPFWRNDLPAGASDQSRQLSGLLEDLLREEAYVEVRGKAGQTETVCAVELNDQQANIWDSSLKQVVKAWKLGTPAKLSLEGYSGWEAKRQQAPNTFSFVRAGKWVLISLAQDCHGSLPDLLKAVKATGRPVPAMDGKFVDVSVDFPGLKTWLPFAAKLPLPAVVASMSGRGANVRTEVRFQYSGKVPWTTEPWRIPSKLVSEPMISFTAIRGIGPLVNRFTKLVETGLDPLPSQFFLWGVQNDQCRLFYAAPVNKATDLMSGVSRRTPKFIRDSLPDARGEFYYETNRFQLAWGNLPFIMPTVQPYREGKQDFLVGGLTLLPPKPVAVPDALFAQLRHRTNLVYYDWELTQERMNHAKQMHQLACIINARRVPETNTASKIWFDSIRHKLGNTVTEILQTGPQELVLVRKSVLGFTAFELATLSAWLDSPGFPYKIDLPPPLQRRAAARKGAKAGQTPTAKPASGTVAPPKKGSGSEPRGKP